MNNLSILTWAAGAPREMPEIANVDQSDLFNLLVYHKLETRFLSLFTKDRPDWLIKLKQGYPDWCSTEFIYGLFDRSSKNRRRVARQIKAVQEICVASANIPNLEVLTVKGFSAYALSGEPNHLNFSVDVDLFAADLEMMEKSILNLGYLGRRQGAHEYASFRRDDITIDLHRYFPVFAYPKQVWSEDLSLTSHTGNWTQQVPAHSVTRIEHDHLLLESQPSLIAETEGTMIPGREMSVLVLCSHEFRSYIEPPFRRSIPIRLSTVSVIHDLVNHNNFRQSHFQRLVKVFSAEDCIIFMDSLLKSYFGSEVLSQFRDRISFDSPKNRFPRMLSYGCWVSFDQPFEDLLLPMSGDLIRDHLASNVVNLHPDSPPVWYVTSEKLHGELLNRVILQSLSGEEFPLRFSLRATQTELHIELQLKSQLQKIPYKYQVRVQGNSHDNFKGFQKSEMQFPSREFRYEGMGKAYELSTDEGLHLNLILPLNEFQPPSKKQGQYSLCLIAMKQNENLAFDPLVIVPISIQCTSNHETKTVIC